MICVLKERDWVCSIVEVGEEEGFVLKWKIELGFSDCQAIALISRLFAPHYNYTTTTITTIVTASATTRAYAELSNSRLNIINIKENDQCQRSKEIPSIMVPKGSSKSSKPLMHSVMAVNYAQVAISARAAITKLVVSNYLAHAADLQK